MKGIYREMSWIPQWRKHLSQENRRLAVPSTCRTICLVICYTVEAVMQINQFLAAHVPIWHEYLYLTWISVAGYPRITEIDSTCGTALFLWKPLSTCIWSCSSTSTSTFLFLLHIETGLNYSFHSVIKTKLFGCPSPQFCKVFVLNAVVIDRK